MQEFKNNLKKVPFSPLGFFIVTLIVTYCAETAIMVLLHSGLFDFPHNWEIFLDGVVLTLVLAPVLFFFLYLPMQVHIDAKKEAENKLIKLNEELETKIAERTEELVKLNKFLEEEYRDTLLLSEEKYKNVVESLNVGVAVISPNMELLTINKQLAKWYPNTDISKKPICYKACNNPPKDRVCKDCPAEKTLRDGQVHEVIKEVKFNGEKYIWRISASPIRNAEGEIVAVTELIEDITARKLLENQLKDLNIMLENKVQERTKELEHAYHDLERRISEKKSAEAALKESNDRYRSLLKQSSEGIFIFDPKNKRVQEANDRFLSLLGYTEEEVKALTLLDIVDYGENPAIIDNNIHRVVHWGETLSGPRVYKRRDGTFVDVEASVSLIEYGKSKVCLVNVRDITERKQAEEAIKQSFLNLKRILTETVNALVALTEKRDAYTAGHQHRVADLAYAIAREMGLSDHQLEAIQIAAALHDIGKIYVPTDILSRPGRLSEVEMNMIRMHPKVGSEILEKIPFEHPIAEIVLQHHERENGSGYPKGLSSEEILLEAKIIAVADVVEAMASHRPYRAALGIDAALAEIVKNKGVCYHPDVVDACERLFKMKGYKLDNNRDIA